MSLLPGDPLLSPLVLACAVSRSPVGRGNVRLFEYGRDAIAAYVGEHAEDIETLFAPSFVCEEATAGLEGLGIDIRYYPVRENLGPDWSWLREQVDGRRQILLLVHYFGFANAINAAVEFCSKHSWLLLEDCAHSFQSVHEGSPLGTFGDAGVYSYRKVLPLVGGAGLITKGLPVATPHSEPGGLRTPVKTVVRQLLKWAAYKVGVPNPLGQRLRATPPGGAIGTVPAIAPRGMSGLSKRLLGALDAQSDRNVSVRRRNYRLLAEAFATFPEARMPFPALDPGTCPYLFPVLVAGRGRIISALRSRGVPAGIWPTLPPMVAADDSFGVARTMANQLMTLPVHQDLTTKDIARIVSAYASVRSAAAAVG